jgi:hypothetical protein
MNAFAPHYEFVEAQLHRLVALASSTAAEWDKPFVERMIGAREYGLALDTLASVFLATDAQARSDAAPIVSDLAARMHMLSDQEYQATAKLVASCQVPAAGT